MTADDLERLASSFADCSLRREEWTHVAHLCVGAWHVHRLGAEAAIESLRTGIRQLNEHHGTPNSPTSGYHETITIAYVRLLDQFFAACPLDMPLHARAAQLIAGPLSRNDLLLDFYTRDRLMSPAARAEWTPPDRAPLRLPVDTLAGLRRR